MKKTALLFLLMAGISLVFAECDMAAMIAKTDYSISTLNTGSGSYDDPDEFIDFLIQYSSASTNPDGYGVTYIGENGYFPFINTTPLYTQFYSAQAWYVTAQNINANNYYYNYNGLYTGPMEAARDAIKLEANDVAIVLGHDRRSNTALGNHPFRFIYDINKTFQFIHNGGIDNDIKSALYTELGGSNWFSSSNHPSNWWNTNNGNPNCNQLIDSEILFHWIMKNIIDNNGDILPSIQQALTATVGSIDLEYEFRNPYILNDISHNVVNFVLTDGETLYIFKNGNDNWDHHLLSWQENDNNSYTVKTQSVLSNPLDQFDLVILSRDDNPIVYNDFFDLDLKIFTPGVTWVSFPRLTQQYTYNGESYEQAYWNTTLQTPGLLQSTSGGEPTIDDFDIMDGNRIPNAYISYVAPNFIDQGFNNMLFRHEGYKVTVDEEGESTTLVVDGDRLPETYTISEALPAYTENWLGYWLPESRNIVDAFGEFWEYVEEVWAEDWYYNKCSNNRGIGEAEPVSWSTANKTLEYGKGYIVQFERILEIEDFCWTPSITTEEPTKKAESENFTYTEKTDYEVIDVVDIPENIAEIGVFQDEVCVGAVVVENECEQILVYSENANREEIPFTFEVVTGNRELNQPVINYLVFNENSGEFEKGIVFSGRQVSSIIKFNEIGEPGNESLVVESIQLYGNYPNPFNPTTHISFSLLKEEEIELIIYNVKGQKVKTLFSGFAEEGTHSLTWDGGNEAGRSVSSGIYFYKLKTTSKELTRKMLMMK